MTQLDEAGLLPCPFCGSEVRQERNAFLCGGCPAVISFPICSISTHAKHLYNTRPAREVAGDVVDKVATAIMGAFIKKWGEYLWEPDKRLVLGCVNGSNAWQDEAKAAIAALAAAPKPQQAAGDVARRGKITTGERIVARCFGTTAGNVGLVQMIDKAIEKAALSAAPKPLGEGRLAELLGEIDGMPWSYEEAARYLMKHATITERTGK